MRSPPFLLASVFLLAALPAQGRTDKGFARTAMAKSGGESKEIATTIGGALQWLQKRQGKNGSFREDRRAAPQVDELASAALALLCFVGDGSNKDDGPFRKSVLDGVRWLSRQLDADGRLALGDTRDERAEEPLLGHAIGTLALFDVGMASADNTILMRAQQAIARIEATRLADGSWPAIAGGATDLRTTLWMLHALAGARHGMLPLSKPSDAAAEAWLDAAAQDTDTGVEARIRNAGGAFLLLLGGFAKSDDERVAAAVGRVAQALNELGEDAPPDLLYFGTYLLHQAGGEHWIAWRDGGLRETRARLEKPAKTSAVEQVAVDALALMSFYRYGPLGR